eukprot:2054585-Rhodomonas_salina.1
MQGKQGLGRGELECDECFWAETMTEPFPIDLKKFQEVELDPWKHETLPADLKASIAANVEVAAPPYLPSSPARPH